MKSLLALATILLGLFMPSKSFADTMQCTAITSLPAIISQPGIYCLKSDLSTTMRAGNAIDIRANSVTIDFNGWKLGGVGAGALTNAVGVYSSNRSNIRLHNGMIRGFHYGIRLDGASGSGLSVEDMQVDRSTYVGVSVSGSNNLVSRNRITNTGPGLSGSYAFALIVAVGSGTKVSLNTISSVSASYYVAAIYVQQLNASEITGNSIYQLTDASTRNAIETLGSEDILVEKNRIINSVPASTGVKGTSITNIWCVDNIVISYSLPEYDCLSPP